MMTFIISQHCQQ